MANKWIRVVLVDLSGSKLVSNGKLIKVLGLWYW